MTKPIQLPNGMQVVIKSNGELALLREGELAGANDIVVSGENLGLLEAMGISIEPSTATFTPLEDTEALLSFLEQGLDPTLIEEFAPAASQTFGSSVTSIQTIERDGNEILADTNFVTSATPQQFENEDLSLFDELNYAQANNSPITFDEVRTFTEESEALPINITLPFDEDSETITITITELPELGAVTHLDGTNVNVGETLTLAELSELHYEAPDENEDGDLAGTLTYTVDDGEGEANSVQTASVQIVLEAINDAPIAFDHDNTVEENQILSVTLPESTDVDGEVVRYELVTPPESGSVVIGNSGLLTFDASEDFEHLALGVSENVTFTYHTVDDDGLASEPQLVTVVVTGTNDAAVIEGIDYGQVEEDSSIDTLLATGNLNVSDVDGQQEQGFSESSITASIGALGSLSIDELGDWTYQVDNSLVQYLGEGETKIETFVVQSLDGTEHTIEMTITGVNDSAVITGNAVGAVTEDDTAILIDSGALPVTDADQNQAEFDTNSVVAANGVLGELTIDKDGNWQYSVDNSQVQYLGEEETKVEVFTIQTLDGTEHTIEVTITGVNDSAVIAGEDDGSVEESLVAGLLSDSGTLTVVDTDQNQSSFDSESVVAPVGALGSLTLDEVGNWQYTVDNALVEYLGDGETKVETFAVLSLDGTEHTIDITITGINNTAVITGDASGSVVEGSGGVTLTDTGVLSVSDVDQNQSEFDVNSVTPPIGALGSLTIDASGNWQYSVLDADVQYLGEGETKTEIFTVSSLDGTEHEITITIEGVNGAAIISGDASGAVLEDEQLTTLSDAGTLSITDEDQGEAVFVPSSVVTPDDALGSLTINALGDWIYKVENADVQYLGEGETKVETFTVESDDGTQHDIEITITGVNDSAVISGDAVGEVIEDESATTLEELGSLRVTDTDQNQSEFDTGSVTSSDGALGSLSIDELGDWAYQVDNSLVQYLGEGETKVETFVVLSLDGTERTIEITITGINDSAVITGNAVGAVTEDDAAILTDSGALSVTDADQNQAEFDTNSVIAVNGVLGSLTIDKDGNWQYSVDNSQVQYLGEDETKVEVFTVQTLDGTEHTIEVTITGVNDSAVIAGEDDGSVEESLVAGLLSDSGSLTVEDTDQNQSSFDSESVVAPVGALGSLTLDEAGNWQYTVDNALVEYLGEGETKVETFTVESDDGTQHDIEITITGINNTAVITGEASGSVLEGSGGVTLTDTGVLSVSDVDQNQSEFDVDSVTPPVGALGSLTIDASGSWQYSVLDADVQYLGEGETKTEIFTVSSVDGTEHEITIIIEGVNGAAVISGDASGAVLEDDQLTTLSDAGALSITDEDQGEAVFVPSSVVTPDDALGSLTINALGEWVYQVENADVQYLGDGETKVETFTVESDDGTQHDIEITITGVNDSAVISGDAVGEVVEDESATTLVENGQLTILDSDSNQAKFDVNSVSASVGATGVLTITESGVWEYTTSNSSVQHLALNEVIQESFTVESVDGTEHTITIDIVGTNDIPSISGVIVGNVVEDSTLQSTGALQVSDVDNGASHTWSLIGEVDSTYGEFSINQSGVWTYDLDNSAAQGLAEGESVEEIFTVSVDDGLGGVSEQQVVITIVGTNDAPVISGDSTGLTVEDLYLSADGVLSVEDIDLNDQHIWSIEGNGEGSYGSITINQQGEWEYTLNPSAVQSFEQGELYEEQTFTAIVSDGQGGMDTFAIDIDILGQNDAPDISGRAARTIYEDAGNKSKTGTLLSGDPDLNEIHTWEIIGDSVGVYGSLSIVDGVWAYTLDTTAEQSENTQALSLNQTEKEYFLVQVTDKHNQVDTKQIVVTVKGRNDSPEIDGVVTGDVTEDSAAVVTTSGQLNHNDVDALDEHQWQVQTSQGSFGSLSIDSNGEWTYTLSNEHSTVQALLPSETLTETFIVTVTDDTNDNKASNNESDTETITITIHGSNDAPTLTGATTGSVIEATPDKNEATGTLLALDIDTNDSHSWAVVGEDITGESQGTYGSLSVDDNGTWTYLLDSDLWATQSIPPGTTELDSFQVQVTDANGIEATIPVVISVAGVNTDPDIQLGTTPLIKEDDLTNQITGTFASGDPDIGDSATWSVVVDPEYGTFTLDTQGHWSYELNNQHTSVNTLDEGDQLIETVQIKVVDAFGKVSIKDFEINIEGTNDQPVIGGAVSKTIAEDTTSVTGTLNDGDPDSDDSHTWTPSSLVGVYGAFTMSSNGSWTYHLDNNLAVIQQLSPDQTLEERFTVQVVDSSGETDTRDVVVSIQGTNDLPGVSGDVVGTYIEDQITNSINGTLTLTDTDNSDSPQFIAGSYVGNLGNFTVDVFGDWTFTANTELLDSMYREEISSEIFTLVATDDFGGVITQDVTIHVEGQNDNPEIYGADYGAVIEDGYNFGLSDYSRASGQLGASDVDKDSSVVSWAIEDGSGLGGANYGQGTYGTLTLSNNGEWIYVLDNTDQDTQDLAFGDVGTEIFYVSATDNDGGTSDWHQISIDVYGQDENGGGAGGGGANLGTLTADLIEDDVIVVTDMVPVLPGNNNIVSVSPVSGGVFGTLIDGSGQSGVAGRQWQYTLDNNSPLVQSLSEGEQVIETWRIETDQGYYDVNVTITGSNDEPVITFTNDPATEPALGVDVQIGTVADIVSTQASGILGVNDPDNSDNHTWSINTPNSLDPFGTTKQGVYGELVMNAATGEWVYNLSSNQAVTDLAQGEVATETFEVEVSDGTATDTRVITISVIGAAEDALIADTQIETLTAHEDVDDQDGNDDGDVTISGALSMPNGLSSVGTWTLVDGDGQYGDIVVDANGSWTYTLNNQSNSVQSLQQGQSAEDTFTLYVVDENGKTVVDANGQPELLEIVVEVYGSPDGPDITGALTGNTNADNTSTISGTLNHGDVDTLDSHTWVAVSQTGNYGEFTLTQNGSWQYDPDETLDALIELNGRDSSPLQETFVVKVIDSTGLESEKEVVVSIHGVNETPIISGDVTAALVEDNQISQSLQLVGTDVDTGDVVTFTAKSLNGTYGLFIIDAMGEWSYSIYNDQPHLQALAKDEIVTESFVVHASDDLGAEVSQTITVTVTGTNDAPVLSGDSLGVVNEMVGSSAIGELTAYDVDLGDGVTYFVASDGSFGTLSVNGMGEWQYVVDETHSSVDALGLGESLVDTILVQAEDNENEASNTLSIQITINGSNDSPAIEAIAVQTINEGDTQVLSGAFDSGDVDINDLLNWEVIQSDDRGELLVDTLTGEWSFSLDNQHTDIDSLAVNETLTLTYTIKVTDEFNESDTETVSFEVTGSNDLPSVVLADSDVTAQIDADGAVGTASGELTINDVDLSDSHSFYFLGNSQNQLGSFGEISINSATGEWEYELDQSAAALLKNELVTDTFTVFVDDDNGGVVSQIITIDIQGTDSAPEITGTQTGQVKEDYINETSGQLAATDIETDSSQLTWQLIGPANGQYGTLSFNASTGAWSYLLMAGSTNNLASNQLDTDDFIVEVSDGVNTTQETVSVSVLGNHLVQGSIGYDLLSATTADEWLWGGPTDLTDVNQADTFSWSSTTVGNAVDVGKDYIKDFDASVDSVDLTDFFNMSGLWTTADISQQLSITQLNDDSVLSLFDINGDVVQEIVIQGNSLDELAGIDTTGMNNQELLSHLVNAEVITVSETYGHEGNDILSGSEVDEILLGGAGEDIFSMLEVNAGTDSNPITKTLSDFNLNEDIVDLQDLLPDSPNMQDLLANIQVSVSDDIDDANDPTSVTLEVTDTQGGKTNVVISNVGWNDMGIADVDNATDEMIISALVDQLKIINVMES